MVPSCLNPAYLDDPTSVTIPSASITLASFVFLVSFLFSHDPVEVTIYTSPPSDIGIVDKVMMLLFLFILISLWILIIYCNTTKSVPHATSKDIQTLPCRRWTQEKYNRIPGDISTGTIHPGFHFYSNHDILLECVICLENFMEGDVVVTLPCDHDFHKACVYTPNTVS
jgi:hypothetical protein